MAPRLAVLIVLSLAAATALAGCQDRLAGTGTLRVVLEVADQATLAAGGSTYPNRLANFSKAEFPIVSITYKRGDAELVIPGDTIDDTFDLVLHQDERITLAEKKVSAGQLASVAVISASFQATLLSGERVTVNATTLPPYFFAQNATIGVGETVTYVLAFMLTEGPIGNRTEYFVAAVPGASGPR